MKLVCELWKCVAGRPCGSQYCLLLLLQGRLSIRSTHKLAEVRLAAKEMG